MYTINNVPGSVTAAYRARNGHIICLARNGGQCITLDTTGKQLKQFACNSKRRPDQRYQSVVQRPYPHHAAGSQQSGGIRQRRQAIVEVDAPIATTATAFPTAFPRRQPSGQRAYKVDRSGKVVWKHKANGNIFRVRECQKLTTESQTEYNRYIIHRRDEIRRDKEQ